MSLKQRVEDNLVVFFLTAVIIGFGAGWGAYAAVQRASGKTQVSIDYLKGLEKDAANSSDPNKIHQLDSQISELQDQLLKNRPTGQDYVMNISLSPTSPAILKPGDHIVVSFDYQFGKSEKGTIFAKDANGGQWQASPPMEGSGSTSRWLSLFSTGEVTSINIYMQRQDGAIVYNMALPVSYMYRQQ